MKDENIQIVDNNSTPQVDNNESTNVVVPETKDVTQETQVISTQVDKKELKRQEKQKRQEEKLRLKEEKRRLKEERKNKGKKGTTPETQQNNNTNELEKSVPVTIVETAITKGASGSQVIGKINGDVVEPTNIPLPEPIDITVKPKVDNKTKTKKVKVVSKRERMVSIIMSFFVIIVLAGAGFCAYYFGYKTNPSIFTLKNIYLELGEQLPSTVSYYIENSNQYDDMEYNLDLSNVAQSIVGTYTYTVTHKNASKSAKVIVQDTKSPTVTIKDSEYLVFQINSKVTKDDIVSLCEDLSNCTYKTEFDINTETPGEKEVTIIAKDDAGNETREVVKIKIIDVQKTLVCTSSDNVSADNKYKTNNIYTLNFDGNDYLVKYSGIIQYTYTDYGAYFEKFTELQGDTRYVFNRMNFTYSESTKVKTNNYTKLNDLVRYYNEQGYTCK